MKPILQSGAQLVGRIITGTARACVLSACLFAVALSACSSASARSVSVGSQVVPAGPLETSVAALCDVGTHMPTNLRVAKSTFYNQSHQNLHVIAKALETADRAEAARLLEAMQRVEADFLAQPPPPAVAGHVQDLTREAGIALRRLSLPAPGCTSR